MRIAITSVHYGDHLAVTLPAYQAIVPSGLFVATSPDDLESQAVAERCGVPCVVTDAWTREDASCHHGGKATFNMALGLDEALGLVGERGRPADGELVGHINPDCYPFGTWPSEDTCTRNAVYGFWRYECLSPKALRDHVAGHRALQRFPKLKNSHGWPIGYCQLFRYQAGRRFGSYPTAGKFDTQFSASFDRQVMLNDVYLLHLGPINVRANWSGRVVPRWGAA